MWWFCNLLPKRVQLFFFGLGALLGGVVFIGIALDDSAGSQGLIPLGILCIPVGVVLMGIAVGLIKRIGPLQ